MIGGPSVVHRRPRRRVSGKIAALVAASLIAGCTGSVATEPTAPMPAAAHQAAPSPSAASPSAAAPSNTTTPTAPVARTTATAGARTTAAGPTGAVTPPTTPPAEPVPGMYGLDRFGPETRGATTTFATSRSCRQVLGTVAAWQWRATVLTTPKDVPAQLRTLMSWYLVALRKGADRAYLKLAEGAQGCDGTLVRATQQRLTLAGGQQFDGSATFIPFQCGPALTDRDSMVVTGFYDSGDVHAMLNVTIPATIGTHPVELADDDPTIQLARGGAGALERFGKAFASSARNGETPSTISGMAAYTAADRSAATVTTTSLAPLEGTMTLRALRGPSGGTLDVTAGFRCDTKPMPSRKPAPSGSVTPTRPALGGDTPASTDGTGAVTVTVGSGPRRGTYRGSGSLKCHHHEFGRDSWWLVLSGDGPGSDDPKTVTLLNLWAQPASEIGAKSAYDEPYVLDIGFGNFVLDPSLQIHVNADVGGRGGTITAKGTAVTATATAAGNVALTITAQCA